MRKITTMCTTGAMAAALALTGCGAGGSSSDGATACKGSKIAYLTPATSISFWRSMSSGIKTAADKEGAKVTVYDSKNSQSTQLKNAQDAITAGVDAIIISPTDSASAPTVLKQAADAKIPVVVADIGTDSGDYVTYVKSDNIGGAKAAGDYLAKRMDAAGFKDAKVGIIGIAQSRQNGKDRTKGFEDAVTATGKTVLPLLESKDYTRSEGLAFTQDLVSANPDMHGIFAEHDEAGQGAVTALGKSKDVLLVSFDGSPDTLKSIEDGTIAGAAMQQPLLMGGNAFTSACDDLDGKPTKKEIQVPTIMVTSENAAEVKDTVEKTVFGE